MTRKSRQKPPQTEDPQLTWIRERADDRQELRLRMRAERSLTRMNSFLAALSRQYVAEANRLSIYSGEPGVTRGGLPRMSWALWYEIPHSQEPGPIGILVGTQRAKTNVELTLTAWNDECQKAMEPFAFDLLKTKWIVETDYLGRAKKPTYPSQTVPTDAPATKSFSKSDLPEEMQFPDSRGIGKRRQAVYKLWRKGELSHVEMVTTLSNSGFLHMNIDMLKHDINYIRKYLKERNLMP